MSKFISSGDGMRSWVKLGECFGSPALAQAEADRLNQLLEGAEAHVEEDKELCSRIAEKYERNKNAWLSKIAYLEGQLARRQAESDHGVSYLKQMVHDEVEAYLRLLSDLTFAASVIKAQDGWSPECQERIGRWLKPEHGLVIQGQTMGKTTLDPIVVLDDDGDPA